MIGRDAFLLAVGVDGKRNVSAHIARDVAGHAKPLKMSASSYYYTKPASGRRRL
jgi:hypothetical protein